MKENEPFDFSKAAETVQAWISDYLENSERYPVLSQVSPGEIKTALPFSAPFEPETFNHVFEDFKNAILPGVTHWNHPAFFAYFAITGSGPGILGEMLSAALNINGMLWKTSPAATELEEVVMSWLGELLDLPSSHFGMIVDTASLGSLLALAAARESLNLEIRKKGLSGRNEVPPLTLYVSEQAHSSIDKAAIVLGIGEEGVRKIGVDEDFRMRTDLLRDAIESDLKERKRPVAVVATIGTTSTSSVDPVESIADICERYNIWLHIDAAYAGSAGILPECKQWFRGIARADTFLFNPHKWLFVPFDCSAFFTKRRDELARTFSQVPEYLRTTDQQTNFMDYNIQLGRRFRALKLWMVIRLFGVRGIQQALRKHIDLARYFAGLVRESPHFQLMAQAPFSLVCFRAVPSGLTDEETERFNERLLNSVNESGKAFLSHTKLRGKFTLRLAIGNLQTEQRHITQLWEVLNSRLHRIIKEEF